MNVGTRSMSWDKDRKTLSTEASTLGILPGCWPGRLDVRSHLTGKTVTFWLGRVERGEEGDTLASYVPDARFRNVLPFGTSLKVLND